MKRLPLWDQLRDDARDFAADVLILDTLADIYGGNEIDRGQVNTFVKACLGRLANEIGGSVIALAHPSLAGKSSGSGTSGSTAWSNAVRSRIYLRYPKGVERGDHRELEGMKTNYAAVGAKLKLRWARGAFDAVAGSRPTTTASITGEAFSGAMPSLAEAAEHAISSALISHPAERLVLDKPNSVYCAAKVLKRLEPDMLSGFSHDELDAALNSLAAIGKIQSVEIGRDSTRRAIFGLALTDNMSGDSAAISSVLN